MLASQVINACCQLLKYNNLSLSPALNPLISLPQDPGPYLLEAYVVNEGHLPLTSVRLDHWRGWGHCTEGCGMTVPVPLMMYLVEACSNSGVKASEKAKGVEFG